MRLVDGEKLAMGQIHAAMDGAKEDIKKGGDENEAKYGPNRKSMIKIRSPTSLALKYSRILFNQT